MVGPIMYTKEILEKGIIELGINDQVIINSIILSNEINLKWLEEEKIRKQKIKDWQDRYKVPQGLTKKELNKLLKETQAEIDYFLIRSRTGNEIEKWWYEDLKNQWVEKKKKIKDTLKFHDNFGSEKLDLQKAKQYPIEQLLEFRAGFAKCPFHDDKHPSAKYYKDKNRIHCFVCNQGFDVIDIVQQIYNLSLKEAINHLCKKI